VAALAEATRTALAPHNPQGPVSTAASLQLGFAEPSYVICETVQDDVPWRADVMRDGFEIDPRTRTVRPSSKPGLGIELDERAIAAHPFEQEVPQRVFYHDGSVGDW
jgi:galactonate dehydratase